MADRPTVVPLPVGNVQDIPALLETVAGNIRSGEVRPMVSGVGVFLNDAGELVVYGWGEADDLGALALLHLGSAWLTRERLG